ncbi:hypothetical protein BP00DRAFT_234972 [Aspergillus indologenus CBS 114.80]|uniref:Uncharacterized protein n=1 Tax=Aspergillus indologenus CBS 114.80 TaxID=1450541 RepID=A0A2V5IMG9_9EURO|nr:hypothetical protein BP00DRAFT_234972 [Aspergillus indologenus CBS 114.80]
MLLLLCNHRAPGPRLSVEESGGDESLASSGIRSKALKILCKDFRAVSTQHVEPAGQASKTIAKGIGPSSLCRSWYFQEIGQWCCILLGAIRTDNDASRAREMSDSAAA